MKDKIFKNSHIIICFILVLGVIMNVKVNSQENNVSAEDLMNEFSQNENGFTLKYTGKKIVLTGKIFDKATPKDNIPEKDFNYIVFGDRERNGTGICVICYFNEFVYSRISIGEEIVVEGNFRKVDYIRNYHTKEIVYKDIILGECKILKCRACK
jgi:hypothetical protein